MCIRDSPLTLAFLVGNVTTIGTGAGKFAQFVADHVFVHEDRDMLTTVMHSDGPVSYTHLDVYKRQVAACATNDGTSLDPLCQANQFMKRNGPIVNFFRRASAPSNAKACRRRLDCRIRNLKSGQQKTCLLYTSRCV